MKTLAKFTVLVVLTLTALTSCETGYDPMPSKPVNPNPVPPVKQETCDIDFPKSSLPAKISNFISVNLPGQQIDEVDVCMDENQTITRYDVEMEGDGELYFSGDGEYLANNGRISIGGGGNGGDKELRCGIKISSYSLPQSIKTYIRTQFPHHSIDDVKVCMRGEEISEYEVELDGNPEYKLYFDGNGNFLRKTIDD